MNFAFLLEGTTPAEPNFLSTILSFAGIALLLVFFYFFMIRPQRKKEKEDQQMRSELQVGDEVTTIGGIIGKVISIKEETFVLETTKDKTRIRFLRGAIRSVDVKIADTIAPKVEEPKADEPAAEESPAQEETK